MQRRKPLKMHKRKKPRGCKEGYHKWFDRVCVRCGKTKEHRTITDIKDYVNPGEVLQIITKRDIPYKEDGSRVFLQTRDTALAALLYSSGLRIRELLSIKKAQVQLEGDPDFIIFKDVRIQKHRDKVVIRDVTINKTGALKPFKDLFLEYWALIKRKHEPRIFKLSRYRAHSIIQQKTGKWPHWFRSQNISDKINRRKMRAISVAETMGIANVQTIQPYYKTHYEEHREDLKK